jgi:Sec-independent protein translocase protein TatA
MVFLVSYIGPGGPEVMVVLLVLLMMFGAKDAPRMLRKLNEILNQIKNTADGFKREIMYGDLKEENYGSEGYLSDDHYYDQPPFSYDEDGMIIDDSSNSTETTEEESMIPAPPSETAKTATQTNDGDSEEEDAR